MNNDLMVKAVGKLFKEQRDETRALIEKELDRLRNFKPPDNYVNVKSADVPVTNSIDLSPLAAAVDRMTAAMAEQCKLLGKLIEAIQRPVNIAAPIVNVPAPVVNVAAPKVTVQAPQASGQKRSMTITHDDGTTSTITEG